jgi:hypothetical protein
MGDCSAKIFVDIYNVYVYIVDMKQLTIVLSLALSALAQIPTPELNQQLTLAAQSMASMNFDPSAPVTVRGRVSLVVFPERTSGVLMVETGDGRRYVFSTAGVPAMAKQGFSRFSLRPGQAVTVVGVLAPATPLAGFVGARADVITGASGQIMFDRTRLEQRAQ